MRGLIYLKFRKIFIMTSKEIRKAFLDFFASKQHKIVPSAPMTVKNDPTLMFTNAGMNQFKDIFLGNEPVKYPRVTDSQKCLRVSGKHNDLEEVGHDTYHHTMFEMLGNWSFGDYFKKEIIDWAWEFLTDVMHIDKSRLYATVFEGSKDDNLEPDNEAKSYWQKYLSDDRIIFGNKHDNFWEMGATGPCGPCSEIHVDIRNDDERKKISGRELVNHDHPQVIEIWNCVFMQYNRKADKSLELLPAKHVDTGMGFERLCMVIQDKQSNYDTDIFVPIINEICKFSGVKYGVKKDIDVACRVIADHIRAISFAIADGQLPSNAKAGYVIRRILRRAVRYAYTFLGQNEPFLYKLLPVLIEVMGDYYPELKLQKDIIEKVILEEETSFLRTLETGIKLLDKVMISTKAAGLSVISGEDAFKLFDTYGFPLDLTELILKENGMSVDEDKFNAEMQKQKQRARNAAAVETGDWVVFSDNESEFVGYDFSEADAEIMRYRKVKQKNQELFQIVLNKTPFYGEMGGQVGDSGVLIDENGNETLIIDTKKENNLTVHIAKSLPADPTAQFKAVVDIKRRNNIARNHTATHLLDYALRTVLGSHVEQKGSFVSDDSLRFDFSHFQKVTEEEIRMAEHIACDMVRQNISLEEFRNLPIDDARAMGAIALFGEKYGEKVRMIKYGPSIELCGGTHVKATGEIGMIKVISEASVAAGVRRIEAVTGEKCEELLDKTQDMIRDIKALFKQPDLMAAVRKSIDENASLKKKIEAFEIEKIAQLKDFILGKAVDKNGVKLVSLKGEFAPEIVKQISQKIRSEEHGKIAFVAATSFENRPTLTISFTDDAVNDGCNAVNIIKQASKEIKGGGGGQAFFAQAGGKDVSGLEKAFDVAVACLG